jgi:high-affinity nickel-transport protein
MRHATDPDHVVAITAILSNERRLGAATRIGLGWGLGHTATVLAVGAAIILFKLSIPARLGLAMEFVVALVLILLGLSAASNLLKHLLARLGLTRLDTASALIVHSHPHSHAGNVHSHAHVHPRAHDTASAPDDSSSALHSDHRLPQATIPDVTLPDVALRRRLLRSFGVGLAHGLAGSAAIALLVLSAIPEPLWATVYLAIFCSGTILGMMLITTAIGAPFVLAYSRMASLHRALALGSGLFSFGFGLFLAYQIAVVDRLFSALPLWTPH